MNCILVKSRHLQEAGARPETQSFSVSETEWVDLSARIDANNNAQGWMLVVYFDIVEGNLKRAKATKPTSVQHCFCFWGDAEPIALGQLDRLIHDVEDWFAPSKASDREKLSKELLGRKLTGKCKASRRVEADLDFGSVALS